MVSMLYDSGETPKHPNGDRATAEEKAVVERLHAERVLMRQEQAAAALANLARDSADNRLSIVEAGGIAALLALMSPEGKKLSLADGTEFDRSSAKAKENTIAAIIQLAHRSRPNQDAIAEAGGIQLLVDALVASSTSKDSDALTQGSLAAEAVWRMSEDHAANKVSCCCQG